MRVLIDTNVISEPTKTRPSAAFTRWIKTQPSNESYLSVLSIGEIHRGIEKLPSSPRRANLALWLDALLTRDFAGRILSVDAQVAEIWGKLNARAPKTIAPIDGLIAATAAAHNLVLVTRNVRDFQHANVSIHNPWDS